MINAGQVKKITNFAAAEQKGLIAVPIAIGRLGDKQQRWSRGRAARLGSAKAPTAVRIRSVPQTSKYSL